MATRRQHFFTPSSGYLDSQSPKPVFLGCQGELNIGEEMAWALCLVPSSHWPFTPRRNPSPCKRARLRVLLSRGGTTNWRRLEAGTSHQDTWRLFQALPAQQVHQSLGALDLEQLFKGLAESGLWSHLGQTWHHRSKGLFGSSPQLLQPPESSTLRPKPAQAPRDVTPSQGPKARGECGKRCFFFFLDLQYCVLAV